MLSDLTRGSAVMLSDLTSDFHNWGYRYITRDIIFYLYQTSPRLLEDDKFDYLIRFSVTFLPHFT